MGDVKHFNVYHLSIILSAFSDFSDTIMTNLSVRCASSLSVPSLPALVSGRGASPSARTTRSLPVTPSVPTEDEEKQQQRRMHDVRAFSYGQPEGDECVVLLATSCPQSGEYTIDALIIGLNKCKCLRRKM